MPGVWWCHIRVRWWREDPAKPPLCPTATSTLVSSSSWSSPRCGRSQQTPCPEKEKKNDIGNKTRKHLLSILKKNPATLLHFPGIKKTSSGKKCKKILFFHLDKFEGQKREKSVYISQWHDVATASPLTKHRVPAGPLSKFVVGKQIVTIRFLCVSIWILLHLIVHV